ncbi:MAG TPA: hypothetical protein VFE07_16430, partial [Marmoricola sp.]|nr:hypothetical protein [Marmoricola sp.]
GAGFAAEPSSIGDVQVAHVVDLGQGKAEHWFQGSSFAVDRRSPRIVLRVSATALEVADLSLAPRASTPDDITPPTISPVTGPASLILDDMLADYYFHGTDPDHPDAVSYQIREAWPAHGASPVWGAPVSASSPFTVHIRAGQTLCLQARTRDWAGNVSAWTGPPCTYVDGQAPVTSMTTRPPRDLLADTPVTLRYRGIEDDVLVSYDLASQIALPGQRWGSWTIQPTTATSATRRVPAGAEQCFLVRARDRVGHVGAYTANDWCVRMPYDDRALVGHRGARRLANAYALGHTVTRIAGRASLTHRGIRARTIDIRVIGQALYQCPRITVGDMRVDLHTCTRTRQGRHIWYHYYFPHDRVGTLRIRPSLRATHGQRIDAVAIGR